MKGRGTNRRVEKLVSAGGVVYRAVNGKVELALCGRREPRRWCLPKGTPDQGESLEETATREVREETGLEIDIEAPIGSINYWFFSSDQQTYYDKTVHFYLMLCKGGSMDLHDPEFDEVQWFGSEESLKTLTYVNEVKLLEKALAMIRENSSS